MKINSIAFKIMIPLIVITILVVSGTLLLTQTYLKEVVKDVFIDLKVHNLKTIYHLEMDNIFSTIKKDGMRIANSKDVKDFLLSDKASKKIFPQYIGTALTNFKNNDQLDLVYVADAKSKYYYNEKGFVKAIKTEDVENQWFEKTLNSEKKYCINIDTALFGKLHIWNDVVVKDGDKKIGLAGCGMDISNIYNLALEGLNIENSNTLILYNSNIILGTSDDLSLSSKLLHESNIIDEKKIAIEKAKINTTKLASYKKDNKDRFILLIPYDELNITMVIDFSKDKLLTPLLNIYNKIVFGTIIVLFLLILSIGIIISYLITKPLIQVAKDVSDFDYRSDEEFAKGVKRSCEIDMIYDAFNKNTKVLKKILNDYKESEELIKNIINYADDIIIYKDINFKFIRCNNAFEKWSEISANEVIGKSEKDIYPLEIALIHNRTDKIVLKEKKTIIVEEKLENAKGEFRTLQIKKSPLFDKNNEIAGIVAVARDITEEKIMKEELIELNATLEDSVDKKSAELLEANNILQKHIEDLEYLNKKLSKSEEKAKQAAQARSNFISSISHELRTPLNSIINFTDQVIEDFDEMLTDKDLQEDTQIYLNRVIENSRHLLQLINDLLEFTKAEVGKMDYNIDKININEVLNIAYKSTVSLLYATDDIEFKLSLYKEDLIAMLDARRFLQILLNLLSNSIKFTSKGSIILRSFMENESIIVEIKDTGKGIPEEKHKSIFDPFEQVKNTDNGTGLGLGLAKKMCDDMGIDISFSSVLGSGTIFRLMIKNASN